MLRGRLDTVQRELVNNVLRDEASLFDCECVASGPDCLICLNHPQTLISVYYLDLSSEPKSQVIDQDEVFDATRHSTVRRTDYI